jgi:hypothetical protein
MQSSDKNNPEKKTKVDKQCDSCNKWGEWHYVEGKGYWIRVCDCNILTETTFSLSEEEQPK